MNCPACLAYDVTTETTTTVMGTQLCNTHGIEALQAQILAVPTNRSNRGPSNAPGIGVFTPPPTDSS